MNLRIVMAFLLYYGIIGLLFTFGSGFLSDSTTTLTPIVADTNTTIGNTTNTNSSQYLSGGSDLFGGIFSAIQKIGQVVGFMFFGMGLPSSTPTFFKVFFIAWQSLITLFGVVVFLSGIHNG